MKRILKSHKFYLLDFLCPQESVKILSSELQQSKGNRKNEEKRITFRGKKEKDRKLFLLLQVPCADRGFYPVFCNYLYQRHGD